MKGCSCKGERDPSAKAPVRYTVSDALYVHAKRRNLRPTTSPCAAITASAEFNMLSYIWASSQAPCKCIVHRRGGRAVPTIGAVQHAVGALAAGGRFLQACRNLVHIPAVPEPQYAVF